jgi:signal transduction histidine kinase
MNPSLKVLIVEDSEDDMLLMLRQLRLGGYDVESERVETSATMQAALEQKQWDLILSDYTMPEFSVPEALGVLQTLNIDLPFIIVSGTIGEETAVAAMKAGANDYLIKGNLARLVPAVERELREVEVRKQRRRAEQALQDSEARYRLLMEEKVRELTRLDKLKDDFLSTISHELRTPMASMKMVILMLEMKIKEEPEKRYVSILKRECEREIKLINDLLDLQLLEVGRHEAELDSICLSEWLPQILRPFYQKTEERQQGFTLSIDPNIPLVTTYMNGLKRVVIELANNAYKFTPSGEKISVRAELSLRSLDDVPSVLLSVCSSGVEIAYEEQIRIFEKFYRIPGKDPWQQGGTGLGLSLVKKLVEQVLLGTVSVRSRLGRTTFFIEFPASLDGDCTAVVGDVADPCFQTLNPSPVEVRATNRQAGF